MKFAPSAYIGPLSRSQGSTTASHNRFGSYFRNRTIPVNPRTSKQTARRAFFGGLSPFWRTLTDAQRLGWANLANQMQRPDSLGVTYALTGLQAFVSLNQNLFTVLGAGAIISDAPALTTPPDSGLSTATAVASTGVIHLNYSPDAALSSVQVEATQPVSQGINFVRRSQFRLISGSTDWSAAGPYVATAAYTAAFGPITTLAGDKIFFRARAIDANGFAGPWTQSSAIIS